MLVYGDHSERADPQARLATIAERLIELPRMPAGIARHAQLVAALVDSGQLLQGLADAEFAEKGCDGPSAATEPLGAFVHALAQCVRRSWDSGCCGLGSLPSLPALAALPAQVELRTPEGFAFYAVYPEAYLDAARRLRLIAPPRVIGIRSIGTTLGDAVAAALDAPPAVTVRPFGNPFARRVSIASELERELLGEERHFVVVDEGPGQSGSSFGAVADWLEQRGVPLERIAFVTSHSGPPGPQASEREQSRWRVVQRAAADFGPQLGDLVGEWISGEVAPLAGPLTEISAGEWRRHAQLPRSQWPAVVPSWERRKFIGCLSGKRVLVKYAGLARVGERKLAMARALHSAGFAAEPLALVHGFLIERWQASATRLSSGDKPVDAVARYLGARARLFPADAGSGASLAHLLEMARRNVSLALGDKLAQRLDRWNARMDTLERRVVRVRTDNRLDRHEWLRLADRRLIKTDALDHHCGHDLIGCQDMAWDVAAAISEFALTPAQGDDLIAAAEHASGRRVDRELLHFYRIAYAAFRLGQARLAADMSMPDRAECRRLNDRAQNYAAALQHLLHQSLHPATRQESLVG